MPSVRNVRHVRLVYRWRKSAEPGWSIHLIHYPSIPDHLTDALRSQSHAAEPTLWSAKLVMPVSPRRNSAEGTLTHLSALRSLITNHLILITATPQSGTPKSCMVRWVQGSAAGTESGRRSPSARRTHQLLILITATPRFGTPKSCMVRWVPRSAAGTESGSASLSAMVVTRMIKLFFFCDYILFSQAPLFPFFHLITTRSRSKCTLCKITM